jgi:uncharacterized protein (DUF2336 family)
MPSPRLPQVQRLIGLARSNGIDVRPTLMRVLVDQFVAEPHHTAAEVTRFGELILNLMTKAEAGDRAVIAEKLADHPQTPAAVARRLAADKAEIALPILARSRALSDDDLFLAVRSGDADKALAVAAREDLGLAALVALEDMDEPRIKAALAARLISTEQARPNGERPGDLGRRFLAASGAQRETIIAELALERRAALPPAASLAASDQSLELAALSRRPGALGEALARRFGLDAALAERIAEDETGEPLIVVARALDLGREATARILLFAHPAIGTSVERVYALTALYDAMPRPAALKIVASWQAMAGLQAPQATQHRTGRHAPVLAQDASDRIGARQAANPAARGTQRTAAPQQGASRRPKGA